MKMAVIDPGKATTRGRRRRRIDTGDHGRPPTEPAPSRGPSATQPEADGARRRGADGLDLQAAVYTPKPVIYSRAQWGADERLRDPGSLHYFEVHAGFVHHTVNANDYTRAEVPGIIRSIYAYHTQSRGWSDIGYNYLVDRFGRIWEGRYGGIDRPVVGAHTLDYNDYAFAMSAIGNYDIHQPSAAMVQAYGALFAWKLSLHGVDASSTKQWVGSRYFQAINGHRDAGVDRLPGPVPLRQDPADPDARRRRAARLGGPRARVRPGLHAAPRPDRAAGQRRPGLRHPDRRAHRVPGPGRRARSPAPTASWPHPTSPATDKADLVVRGADGTARVYPGNGAGGFGGPVKQTSALRRPRPAHRGG